MSSNRYHCDCGGNRGALSCAMNGWYGSQSAYYNGPCPNVNGEYACWRDDNDEVRGERRGDRRGEHRCGCCRGRGDRDGNDEIVRGAFASPTPLSVITGAAIPLIACGKPCDIDSVGGTVQIEEKGVYYAAYTVTLPAGETLTTTLTPTLNGAVLPAGILEVDSAAAGALPVFSGQVIFYAGDCDRFALTTSEAITSTSGAPLVTAEVMRISE